MAPKKGHRAGSIPARIIEMKDKCKDMTSVEIAEYLGTSRDIAIKLLCKYKIEYVRKRRGRYSGDSKKAKGLISNVNKYDSPETAFADDPDVVLWQQKRTLHPCQRCGIGTTNYIHCNECLDIVSNWD